MNIDKEELDDLKDKMDNATAEQVKEFGEHMEVVNILTEIFPEPLDLLRFLAFTSTATAIEAGLPIDVFIKQLRSGYDTVVALKRSESH